MPKQKKISVSQFDKSAYSIIRGNIRKFLSLCAKKYDNQGRLILDIAPQIHEGAVTYFKKGKVQTLDIDPNSNATYIADITKNNSSIMNNEIFDIVVCAEVLEHTLNPFLAVEEMFRILKNNGVLIVSAPFNFRIHGPLPDCWRFTEHGLRALFKKFSKVSISSIPTPGRDLMPIHYTILVIK